MTKEIKFRAWDKETGKMHYVVNKPRTEENVDDELIIQFSCTGYSARTNKKYIGDECLMQYTGLKDKNGKEIFEGDILADNTSYYYTLIGWDLSGFKSKSVLKGGLNLNHSMPTFEFKNIIDYDDFARMKIVGNIYENPELLEAKND